MTSNEEIIRNLYAVAEKEVTATCAGGVASAMGSA
jgi:hypothetical protein